jgi:S-adenosylmethionine synthetase
MRPREALERKDPRHQKSFDLRLGLIIRAFNLTRPIGTKTASYRHFSKTDIEAPSKIPKQFESLPRRR